jgi:hypothetical protein
VHELGASGDFGKTELVRKGRHTMRETDNNAARSALLPYLPLTTKKLDAGETRDSRSRLIGSRPGYRHQSCIQIGS